MSEVYVDQVNVKIKDNDPVRYDIHARATLVTPGDITKLTANGEVIDSGILDTDVEQNIVGEEGYTDLYSTLDITASEDTKLEQVLDNLADRSVDYATRIEDLEFSIFSIDSFKSNITSAEFGDVKNPKLTWGITIPGDGKQINAQYLTSKVGNIVTNIDLNKEDREYTATGTVSTTTWNLYVQLVNGGSYKNTEKSPSTITFMNRVYWGGSASTTYDNTFIHVLASNALATSRSRSITANLTSGQYMHYAIPVLFGTPTFMFGGNVVEFSLVASNVDYSNGTGDNKYTTKYNIYRSPGSGGGSTTYTVS